MPLRSSTALPQMFDRSCSWQGTDVAVSVSATRTWIHVSHCYEESWPDEGEEPPSLRLRLRHLDALVDLFQRCRVGLRQRSAGKDHVKQRGAVGSPLDNRRKRCVSPVSLSPTRRGRHSHRWKRLVRRLDIGGICQNPLGSRSENCSEVDAEPPLRGRRHF